MFVGITATFYLWVVANHAFGAIQDIKPDREAGISSIATKLGSARTLTFVVLMYLLAMITPIIHFGVYGLIGSAMVAPYLLIALGCWKNRYNSDAPQFSRGWKRFLTLNYVIGAVASIIGLYLYNR
jgi:4-hydroxybenzoate polyprenyltransferase